MSNLEKSCEGIIKAIEPDNWEREGLAKTPERMAKMFRELTTGYDEHPLRILQYGCFEAESEGMILTGQIQFFSMCEHHLAPFFGTVVLGYLPDKKMIGLSKVARLVNAYARRLQVQERLTNQIANTFVAGVEPKGVGVVVKAQHLCMAMRGVEKPGSVTTTCEVRGLFKESDKVREEFLHLANLKP